MKNIIVNKTFHGASFRSRCSGEKSLETEPAKILEASPIVEVTDTGYDHRIEERHCNGRRHLLSLRCLTLEGLSSRPGDVYQVYSVKQSKISECDTEPQRRHCNDKRSLIAPVTVVFLP